VSKGLLDLDSCNPVRIYYTSSS